MGGPAGVADAVGAIERLEADGLFQVAQLAFGAANLQLVSVAGDGDSGRVVAAIFQPPQAINDDRNDLLFADVSDDATHAGSSRRHSVCRGTQRELFNDGVGEYFASNAFDFGLRLLATSRPPSSVSSKYFPWRTSSRPL